jgi:putative hemolysin
MLPADSIAMIPECASLADALVCAHIHMHTRYPICSVAGDPQTITGYVNFKDIVAALKIGRGEPGLKGITRPIRKIDESTPLSNALAQMLRENAHIACVTRRDGAVLGLLTLEDIMEELVGDIGDEYDRLPTYVHPLAWGWIVGSGVAMQQLAKETGVTDRDFPAGERTLAGWCETRHPAPLSNEDVVRADGLEVQVRKMRRGRVYEALVRRVDAPSPGVPS